MTNLPIIVYLIFIGIIFLFIYLIKKKIFHKNMGVIWVISLAMYLVLTCFLTIMTFISYTSFDNSVKEYIFTKTYITMLNEEIVEINKEILFRDDGDGVVSEKESIELKELYFKKEVKVIELKEQINKLESIAYNLKAFMVARIPRQVEIYNSIPSLNDGYKYEISISGELIEVIS